MDLSLNLMKGGMCISWMKKLIIDKKYVNKYRILDVWKEHVQHLNKNGSLKVIAWVELNVSTENMLRRAKTNMSTRRKELRKRLTWLTSDVDIMNVSANDDALEGVKVNFV